MNLNAYLGWGLTTLALKYLNKRSSSSSDSGSEPDDLSVTDNATRIGNPIPVVFGRAMIKSPLIAYFGDFESRAYTEQYSAHAKFSAWPLVFSIIANYIASAITGHINPDAQGTQTNSAPVQGNAYGGSVSGVVTKVNGTVKDDLTGPLINALFMWLISWLINGRNLHTTIQKGFKYYLGYQFLVCWTGDNIGVKAIYMNAYDSNIEESSMTAIWANGSATKLNNPGGIKVKIDNEDMFGGVDERGGFVGEFHIYFGDDIQGKDPWMVAQMSQDSVQSNLRGLTPVYRPFLSIVVPKAYIGKQASIPETWIEVVNIPNKLGLGAIGEDANPAEVIYEAYVNNDWGLDEDLDQLDTDALVKVGQQLGSGDYAKATLYKEPFNADSEVCATFVAVYKGVPYNDVEIVLQGPKFAGGNTRCEVIDHKINIYCLRNSDGVPETSPSDIVSVINADNLANRLVKGTLVSNGDMRILNPSYIIKLDGGIDGEGLGISGQISSVTKAETFIDQICTHINAVKYLDPVTGKMTVKLIRDSSDKVLKANITNCSECVFTRLDWSETISGISASFTDASNKYETSTVPMNDSANVQINNVRTTKTYDYPLFTTPKNALTAAGRELLAQAYPLSTIGLTANRTLSSVRIGDQLELNWPPYGIESLLIRVTNVDIGDLENGEVKIDAIEDVFGFDTQSLITSNGSGWTNVVQYPRGSSYYKYLEMPYELIYSTDTYVYGLSERPTSITTTWKAWRKQEGATAFVPTNKKNQWSGVGEIQIQYPEDTLYWDYNGFEIKELGNGDIIRFLESYATADISAARVGNKLLMIGNEIMAYSTINRLANGHFQVQGIMRGVLDTVPQSHNTYDTVYFLRTDQMLNMNGSTFVCTAGNIVKEQYNITTASVDIEEDFDYTKVVELTSSQRAERPSPLGNVQVLNYPTKEVPEYTRFGDAVVYSKVTFRFTPRDKFTSIGIVAQDDIKNYYNNQTIVNQNVSYLARVSNPVVSVDYSIARDASLATTDDASQTFEFDWQEWCNIFSSTMREEATIELYQVDSNGLLSHQPQVRKFTMYEPTVTAVFIDSPTVMYDIGQYLINFVSLDRAFVAKGSYFSSELNCLFTRMPLIIVGTKENRVMDNNDLIDADGNVITPTRFFMFKNSLKESFNKELQEIFPEDNYVFKTPYNHDMNGKYLYYKMVDGELINLGENI